jgi:tetratricopeptide (TPR) repeat protein
VYGKKKEYDLAISQYKGAIRIKPDFMKAHHFLGMMYTMKG